MSITNVTKNKTTKLCTFSIESNRYGIDIEDIKEISNELNITKIYHSDDSIEGYVNMRGEIYLVANLRKLLGFQISEHKPNNRILYFKQNTGGNFGILVDEVNEVVTVESSNFGNANESHNNGALELCQEICCIDGKIIAIVNAKQILNHI